MDSFFRILLEDGDDILLESSAFLLLETAPSIVTADFAGAVEAFSDMSVTQILTGTLAAAGEAYGDNWQMSYQVVSVRGVAYDYSGPYALVRDESQGYP